MAASQDEQARQQAEEARRQQEAKAQQSQARQAEAPKAEAQQDQARQAEAGQNEAEDVTLKSPLNPFPDFGSLELDELRGLAKEKGVGVPADVEKAALVAKLRQVGPGPTDSSGEPGPHDIAKQGEATGEVQVTSTGDPYPSYDLLTVEELRGLLPDGESALTEDEERGYLVGQLRAVASGPMAAQSAQVGSNRPGDSLDVPSGVSDKNLGRG